MSRMLDFMDKDSNRSHGDHARHGRQGDHGSGHGESGERGKSRFFQRGEFKFALLEILVSEPMHGYQMIKAMEEKTGGLYVPSAGSIYPNLQLLEDQGFIKAKEMDGKKVYHITGEGILFLQERQCQEKEDKHRKDWHRHRHEQGKSELWKLKKEWPGLVRLIARAAKESSRIPEQHAQFCEIMEKLHLDLTSLLVKGEV
jgi:DNA-binding PadR family transcriptional regulator